MTAEQHPYESHGSIENFLHLAEKRLRRHLPKQRLAETLDEARGHLTQRADELDAAGMSRHQAEADAVKSFGDGCKYESRTYRIPAGKKEPNTHRLKPN